jgi:hypothetical protein
MICCQKRLCELLWGYICSIVKFYVYIQHFWQESCIYQEQQQQFVGAKPLSEECKKLLKDLDKGVSPPPKP